MYASLILLFSIYSFANGVGFHGFTFKGIEDVETYGDNTNIKEGWIDQPLDHFNPRDNRSWSMRYYENTALFNKTGPILIMLGGEWEISMGFLKSGLMYSIASAYGGAMYYTEHRYYGRSHPTEDKSSENLQYLNVDQALADVAYFIETKKKELKAEDSVVIVFGGSYAGNMAAWARIKYPHLIQGALASSAPVFAKANFHEYYSVVTESLRKYSDQCVEDIKRAFELAEELLNVKGGPKRLKNYFNLCSEPKSSQDESYFMLTLADKFAGIVQYDKMENNQTKIAACCNNMTAIQLGSPLQRLARLMQIEDGLCLDISYKQFVSSLRNTSWETNGEMRQWYYQTCTEYGYYQTTGSNNSIFGTRVPLDFYLNLCTDLYGNYYDFELLKLGIERTNLMYGGSHPDVSNVIFTNGEIDPWHALSVLQHLSESAPAILIPESSHCRDLYDDVPTDPKSLIEARKKVRLIINKWIVSS